MFKQKGQSTVEYLLLFTSVIVVMILMLTRNGQFKNTIQNVLNDGIRCLDSATNQFRAG